MDEYISREEAVDAGYLSDWYIASVGNESPVWTDEHIDELLNDFIVIPKDTPAADVQPVKHGRWKYYENNGIIDTYICTNCQGKVEMAIDVDSSSFKYCPNCGARMDGDKE